MKTQTVINYFGGGWGAKAKIARAIGISPAAVSKWGDDVPKSSAYDLLLMFPDLENADAIDKGDQSPQEKTV